MDFNILYQPLLNNILSMVLFSISMISLFLSVRSFRRAYHLRGEYSCATWILRGIRFLLICLAGLAWTASLFWAQTWLFIISLVIICQEMFEGLILSQILKTGEQIEKGQAINL